MDGVSDTNMNKPEKALKNFTKAIKIDPERADAYVGRANAYINRGIAHSHLGQSKKAVADYEKGLALDPEIDDPPGFIDRLFSNEPNTDKGIRRHLEQLKQKVDSG